MKWLFEKAVTRYEVIAWTAIVIAVCSGVHPVVAFLLSLALGMLRMFGNAK